jgi:hypothetical protein
MMEQNFYTIAFYRDFLCLLTGRGERYLSINIFTTDDKNYAIEQARRMNTESNVNIHTEHFQVWVSPSKKFSKKSKIIYPTTENSLF